MEQKSEIKFYITQTPYSKNDFSCLDTIYALKDGILYERSVIGNWEKLDKYNSIQQYAIDHFNKECREGTIIDLAEYAKEYFKRNGNTLKTFLRTEPLFRSRPNGTITKDTSFMDYTTMILLPLPNGALITYSDFIDNHMNWKGSIDMFGEKFPIGVVRSDYTKDGKFKLEDSGIPVRIENLGKALNKEFEDDVSCVKEIKKREIAKKDILDAVQKGERAEQKTHSTQESGNKVISL